MNDIRFNNANAAFEYLYDYIMLHGSDSNGTKSILNTGFYIDNPLDNDITCAYRKWSKDYADYEWSWYLSGNPNAEVISQRASIWKSMMDENGNVNSNYGYQWRRNKQLDNIIELLRTEPNTRRASISLYDGKEFDLYKKDTVCTYSINFTIKDNKLNMSVLMRSNDLVFGFCNDQYCFSKLQELVSKILNKEIGYYYHFAQDLHVYERHFNLKNK